jgi:hypothetical protein
MVDDYTEVLTTLMRFPGGQDPLQFFLEAVHLAENGGRVRTVTPPAEPVPPPRAIPPPPPAPRARPGPPPVTGPIDMTTFRSKLIAFYQRYALGSWPPSPCPGSPPHPTPTPRPAAHTRLPAGAPPPSPCLRVSCRYNPTKVEGVDGILSRYEGQEANLVRDLIHGAATSAARAPRNLPSLTFQPRPPRTHGCSRYLFRGSASATVRRQPWRCSVAAKWWHSS